MNIWTTPKRFQTGHPWKQSSSILIKDYGGWTSCFMTKKMSMLPHNNRHKNFCYEEIWKPWTQNPWIMTLEGEEFPRQLQKLSGKHPLCMHWIFEDRWSLSPFPRWFEPFPCSLRLIWSYSATPKTPLLMSWLKSISL